MICYRDKTFCGAVCFTLDCHRQFTSEERARAERWWGGPGAPVAFADFSANCTKFAPKDGTAEQKARPRADLPSSRTHQQRKGRDD